MTTTVQITIPTIGTKLLLTRGWTFTLYAESRNDDFGKRLGFKNIAPGSRWGPWRSEENQVTIPKGTTLIVDRIYIRQNKGDYDSITFRIVKKTCPDKNIWGRFWARLGDVNRIRCTFEEDTVKRDTKVDAITRLGDMAL
ncbi:MAG TPA: hypothetical protein VFH61_18425 [Thermoleophilia bacterium]|nr:hypothetical protein [Thermoleophilia bacterium]